MNFQYLRCENCGQLIRVITGKNSDGTKYIVECGNCEANMQCVMEGRRLKVIETVTV